MRVAYVNPQSYGNLEIYDRELLSAINADGIEIDYFVSTLIKKRCLQLKYKGIFTYNSKKGLIKFITYLINIFRLYMKISIANYHVVHFQWLKLPLIESIIIGILKYTIWRNTKIIYTAHNLYPHDSPYYYRLVYKYVYHAFDVIITHDDQTKKAIKQFDGFLNVEKVHCGPFYLELDDEIDKALVKKIDTFSGKFVLVFGSAAYYKGSDLLQEVWEKSQLHKENYKLVVLGRGFENFIEVSDEQNSILVVPKFVSNATLDYIIQECKFSLLPYREISQSGVLMTLVNYHKPFLIPKRGAFVEIVEKFKPVTHLGSLETSHIAEQCCMFVKSLDDNKRFINFDEIKEAYSWKKAGLQTREIYDAIGFQGL